ncbi:MAG: hypothetical protein WBY88_02525 [Desulfosarcina sp.]
MTVCQSVGVFTPLPHEGGLFDAYVRLMVDRTFRASFAFSLGVAAVSAVAIGMVWPIASGTCPEK